MDFIFKHLVALIGLVIIVIATSLLNQPISFGEGFIIYILYIILWEVTDVRQGKN